MTLRAYVVDDEPLAITRLVRLLDGTGRVVIAGTASHAEAAQAALRALAVDVAFLDISMPTMTGFELLTGLPAPPWVVFTTAFDEFAVKAFQVGAVDYLLKPVQRHELVRALDRVEARRRERGGPPDLRALCEAIAASLRASAVAQPERLASRLGDRICFVDVARISHVYADHKLTYAVADGKPYCLDSTLAALERRLDPKRFVRIHRRALVSMRWIQALHADDGGQIVLELRDQSRTRLIVSKGRAAHVKARLGL
ncbi:MAG TPA: LytTR family DNA-binding domain-containing protein [Vicinamibacterales bacterium]